jgi:acetyl esterase/lipase
VLGRRDLLRVAAATGVAAACGKGPSSRRATEAGGVERIVYGGHASNFAELRVPAGPGPHPVVVVLHGGYWMARYDLTYIVPLAEAITREGFATLNVEYRRLGDGGGYPATFEDVSTATEALRRLAPAHGLDLDRVTALGHSAGGQLAIWLASRARRRFVKAGDPVRIARVVPVAAVLDLRRLGEGGSRPVIDLIGGPTADRAARYAELSPFELLPLGVPQVVLHGTADGLLPIADAERYVETARARGDDARLVRLDGLGHVEPVDPASSAWSAVKDAISSESAPTRPTS